ncbi:hypothetical protein [Rubritalea marina]|uniref:hypothetical protein n=1 Tax=Rubritalea marina TaxID=361055 RepID=UPI0003658998|nr:hypothetical protein [Rubritalea marina]
MKNNVMHLTRAFLAVAALYSAYSSMLVAEEAKLGIPAKIHLDVSDSLHGEVLSMSAKGGIQFRSDLVDEPLQIDPASFHSIKFTTKPQDTASKQHIIMLNNEDVLASTLLQLDDESAKVAFTQNQQLTIAREHLSAVTFKPFQTTLFDGPEEGDIFHSIKNWEFEPKALYCSQDAQLSLKLKLPAKYQFSLDYSWGRQTPNMIIILGAPRSELEDTQFNFYALQVGDDHLQIHRFYSDGTSKVLDEFALPKSSQTSRSLVIGVDRDSHSISINVDESLHRSVIDPDARDVRGRFLVVHSHIHNSAHPARITKILVESSSTAHPHHEELPHDGDRIIADGFPQLKAKISSFSIQEGALKYRDLDSSQRHSIDLEELQALTFQHRATASSQVPQYIFHLLDSSRLSSKSLEFADGTYTVEHPLIGKFLLGAELVNSITLHSPEAHD